MSMTSANWSSESKSVDGIWTETTVKVEETFEYPDGSTQTKTRTIELDGKPTQIEINAMVESTREPQNSDCTKQTEEDFQREAVREHNTLRQRHGVPPLSLAQDLCVLAQEWANYLINNNKHGHSSNKLGENLADKAGNYPNLDYAGREVTKYWYSENENYQFYGMEPPSYEEIGEDKEYGHFTQVVWKGSREMGIGKAKKDDRVVVVANYRPAGNCIGFYAKNVFPPK